MKVKGIMFYGFAAAILTGTAHAAPTPFTIASQAYVDEQVSSVSSKVGNTSVESQINTALESYTNTSGMNTAISNAVEAEATLRSTADTGLSNRITTLETSMGGANAGSVSSQIDNKIESALGEGFPENSTVKAQLDLKQDASASNVQDLETGSHLTAGTGVAANLKALDTNLRTAESTIGTHTTNISGLTTRMETAESTIGTHTTNISGLTTRMETAEGKISTLEGTVGDSTSGLVKDVESLKSNMGQSGSVADQIAAKLGNDFPANSTVKAQLDLKQDASKSTVANGTYAHITQGDGVAANLVSLNSALVTAESSITTINKTAVMNSGIDSTKVGQIATNTTNISNNANNISGLDTRTAILANKTCGAESGRCVLSVDNNGNLAWVAVTDPAESNN